MIDFLEKEVDEAFCVSVIKKEAEICPNVMLSKKKQSSDEVSSNLVDIISFIIFPWLTWI
jgi:hypothetical protein